MSRNKKIVKTPKNEAVIQKMASIGATNKEIAELYGMDENTLKRNYEIFLTKGRSNLKMKLRRKMIEVATKGKGNVVMLIFLAKCYLKMNEEMIDEDKKKLIVFIKDLMKDELNNQIS